MNSLRASIALGMSVCLLACSGTVDDDAASAPPTTTTTTAPGSSGCAASPVASPGVTQRTLRSGGVERRFELTVPASYDGSTPIPVVLGLHALTVDYHTVAALSGFAEAAARFDFIAVAPSGLVDGTTPYWMAAPTTDNDDYDVEFIVDLLDQLEGELCIDTARVFSLGMSNGAQMSSHLACRVPERIAGVAAIAGVEFFPSCEAGPVPVIAFHGSADEVVTYDGGGLDATTIADIHHWHGDRPAGIPTHEGVDAAMATWAQHNGCDPRADEEQIAADVRRRSWAGCDADTVLYIIDGAGHTWPGKPQPAFEALLGSTTTSIDASELLFEFLLG